MDTMPITVRMRAALVKEIRKLGKLRPTIRKILAAKVGRPELAEVNEPGRPKDSSISRQ
jgi:hypothetical protein